MWGEVGWLSADFSIAFDFTQNVQKHFFEYKKGATGIFEYIYCCEFEDHVLC